MKNPTPAREDASPEIAQPLGAVSSLFAVPAVPDNSQLGRARALFGGDEGIGRVIRVLNALRILEEDLGPILMHLARHWSDEKRARLSLVDLPSSPFQRRVLKAALVRPARGRPQSQSKRDAGILLLHYIDYLKQNPNASDTDFYRHYLVVFDGLRLDYYKGDKLKPLIDRMRKRLDGALKQLNDFTRQEARRAALIP